MVPIDIGRYSERICHVEYSWFGNQPRLGLHLDVSTNPILDLNGNLLPLSHKFGGGGFKDENKSIVSMGFTKPTVIAKNNNLIFVHLFILNNILHGSGTKDQKEYYDNFVSFLKRNIGLDLNKANKDNVKDWENILQFLLTGKTLVSNWSQWWPNNKKVSPFAGPDGNDMEVI